MKKMSCSILAWAAICFCMASYATAQTNRYKVLVVMSYEETFQFVTEIKEGIDSVLAGTCEMKYFYMDTKRNLAGGEQKAKEAYALYQEFQPDGVIAADDNAQSMFVVPYLKDKVKTPVMFCGVNADPEIYGYPASNVSGILERFHLDEAIAFVKQLVPSVQSIGYLVKESPTGNLILKQVEKEKESYLVKSADFKMPKKTLKEAVEMTEQLKKESDILFMTNLQGLLDENGNSLDSKMIIPMITKIFAKPTICAGSFEVKDGVLCAVILTGQEQGKTAAEMLLKAMQGTPAAEIPITRNYHGKRLINVDTMKALGIKPKPVVLLGAELVRTETKAP